MIRNLATALTALVFLAFAPGPARADIIDSFCTGLANTSSAAAEARDAGVTMDELLISINASCYSEDWRGIEAECQKMLGNLVAVVYANTNMSPQDLYQETYLICLDGFEE